jgi:hypothetical protein
MNMNGEVTMNQCPIRQKSLKRFIEKQLSEWLEEKHVLSDAFADPNYRVEFDDLNDGQDVTCHVQVQVGEKVFRAADFSHNQQHAFLHSIKRLSPARV